MKITLINPRYTDIYGRYEKAARKAVLACPPLGILYLAASLEKYGHNVSLIDAEPELLTDQQIIKRIKRNKPQVLGVTSTTPTHHQAERLFSFSKKMEDSVDPRCAHTFPGRPAARIHRFRRHGQPP